ncbi:MAG: leucine-rich repeat domain-containing protein [Clostridia bacterium]|nr:leucine-rich repeat domain-containing protein [Clostridia bacterium]
MKKWISVFLVVFMLTFAACIKPDGPEAFAQQEYNDGQDMPSYESDPVPGWDNSVDQEPNGTPLSVSVGDTITFGAYEQDGNESNGKEPIEWLVLDADGSKALLISKYALDNQYYHEKEEDVTWETCTLRAWLNDTFFNNAFNSDEQARIQLVQLVNHENHYPGKDNKHTPGGNATNDRVFLLSMDELKEYEKTKATGGFYACKPTVYAEKQDVFINSETGYCNWWLRTPGFDSQMAALVNSHFDSSNSIVSNTGSTVNGKKQGVRPAMWITLGASAASNPQQQTEVTTPAQTNESAGDQVVTFKDAAFEKAFRENYGFTGTIYESDILAVTELNLDNCGLTDISDVALFKNLTELSLRWNAIEDISVLQGLTELSSVYLYDNKIGNQDITVLSGLTNLTYLNVGFNQISDISALRSLTNLTYLYLSGNQISDISALAGLTNLTELLLEVNPLGDISALKGLTNLKELYLNNCGLTEAQINELKALLLGCEIFS